MRIISVGILALALIGCSNNRVVNEVVNQTTIIEENLTIDQILSAARSAAIAAGSLSASIDSAVAVHSRAVGERNNALLSGNSFVTANRAESVAATSVRAVGVTIEETAVRSDALVGAGADAPRRYDLSAPLSLVSRFTDTIAEKHDTLNAQVNLFSVAARNVHAASAEVLEAVSQANNVTDALAAADAITVARNALDDALAEVVRADVMLIQILEEIKLDANLLAGAARDIGLILPGDVSLRRDIE